MRWGLLLAALLLPGPALARPVVVELFTSEACSDCPPAERFLRQLQASDPKILPLSFHVTYWDGPAWTDRYSLQASTDRQDWYAGLQNSEMYTPETVVDGGKALVGSDRAGITAAIGAAQGAASVPVAVRDGAQVVVTVGGRCGAGDGVAVRLRQAACHADRRRREWRRDRGRSERGSQHLTARHLARAGGDVRRGPAGGAKLAVLVQRDDGVIEGAATD